MIQNYELPIVTVIIRKVSLSFILAVVVAVATTGLLSCKNRAIIEVPQNILRAKDATPEELMRLVNSYDGIQTLQANIKAEYTSEEKDYDQIELEQYPKAPGYIVLKRPGTTYMVIQNPILKKREISFLSLDDEFRVWIHGKSKLYIGKNSSKELISDDLEESPKIPIRATHVYQAILPQPISIHDPEFRISKTERRDENTAYYILTVYGDNGSLLLVPLREFQIERVDLTISRQLVFDTEGQVEADISYSDVKKQGEYFLPGKIRMKRPLDGYNLDLELKDWEMNNPVLTDDKFKLDPPPGVKVIHFK